MKGLLPVTGGKACANVGVGGEEGVKVDALGGEDALTGDDVEDVTDGDGSRFAVGLAEGEEEGWFDGFVEVGVEGAVVEGVDDGEDGVAATDLDDADHLGRAGAADAGCVCV